MSLLSGLVVCAWVTAPSDVGVALTCDEMTQSSGDCEAIATRLSDLGYRTRVAGSAASNVALEELVVSLTREDDHVRVDFDDNERGAATTLVPVQPVAEERRRIALIID